jgi:hypothetical protein
VAAPVSELLAQLRLLNTAPPVPLSAMMEVVPVEELLSKVMVPVAVPAVVGSKVIVSVAVCPTASVSGKLAPETLKPVPVAVAEVMESDAVPVEDRVIDWVVLESTATLPKFTFDELRLRVAVEVSVVPELPPDEPLPEVPC